MAECHHNILECSRALDTHTRPLAMNPATKSPGPTPRDEARNMKQHPRPEPFRQDFALRWTLTIDLVNPGVACYGQFGSEHIDECRDPTRQGRKRVNISNCRIEIARTHIGPQKCHLPMSDYLDSAENVTGAPVHKPVLGGIDRSIVRISRNTRSPESTHSGTSQRRSDQLCASHLQAGASSVLVPEFNL